MIFDHDCRLQVMRFHFDGDSIALGGLTGLAWLGLEDCLGYG